MADSTKCVGENCKDKQNCYRYRAPESEYRQSGLVNQPGIDKECGYYIPYERED